MNILSVEPISFNIICKVIGATHISAYQKEKFFHNHSIEIGRIMESKISSGEFQGMMSNRPLVLFKPIKNSFTKAGDKMLLAETLGIKPKEVTSYVRNVVDAIKSGNIDIIPEDKLETVKTYVYRHGKKGDVIDFLDYELAYAGDILGVLYRTLSYNAGGVADYFVRPIHRMNNSTLVSVYDVIDKNLKNAKHVGNISVEECDKTSEWALVRIYEIQNNQKLRNAVKLRDELS